MSQRKEFLSDYLLNEFKLLHINYTEEDLRKVFKEFTQDKLLDIQNEKLLFRAFCHKSFVHEAKLDLENNERLEFLGDAVLQLIISEKLMTRFPDEKEGRLSKLRSSLVNEHSLAKFARFLNLDEFMMLGRGEFLEHGQDKDSLLSDTFEAYLGAIYLSEGLEICREFVLNIFKEYEEKYSNVFTMDFVKEFDAKSRLQELTMKLYQKIPRYSAKEVDYENEKLYKIEVFVGGSSLGHILHYSKKKGMQKLASKVLKEETYKGVADAN